MVTFARRHEVALQYVFCEWESAIGMCSSYGALAARLLELRPSRAPGALLPLEAWACWSNEYRAARGRRALGALRALRPFHAMALQRLYGPRCPDANYRVLGELAPLARYTPSVLAAVDGIATRDGADVLRQKLKAKDRSVFVATCQCEARVIADEARAAFAEAYE